MVTRLGVNLHSAPNGSKNMTKSIFARIVAGAFAITVLLLLAAWAAGAFVGLSGHGTAALTIGIVLSMALGIGLMVAMFASSRSGHDDNVSELTDLSDKPDER